MALQHVILLLKGYLYTASKSEVVKKALNLDAEFYGEDAVSWKVNKKHFEYFKGALQSILRMYDKFVLVASN